MIFVTIMYESGKEAKHVFATYMVKNMLKPIIVKLIKATKIVAVVVLSRLRFSFK